MGKDSIMEDSQRIFEELILLAASTQRFPRHPPTVDECHVEMTSEPTRSETISDCPRYLKLDRGNPW